MRRAIVFATAEAAEEAFYDAMQRGDAQGMMALWADDDEVFCVHPGGPRVVGPQAIRLAFEAVFASSGRIHVQPERQRRVHSIDSAVHNLVERVELHTDEGVRTGFVVATNVYIKTAQGWRMVAHHASPGTTQETPEIAETPSVLH